MTRPRNSDGGPRHGKHPPESSRVLWLSLHKAALIIAFAVALYGTIVEASVPLTVKCRCEFADVDHDIAGKTETLWMLPFDHFGSIRNLDTNCFDGWSSSWCVSDGLVKTENFVFCFGQISNSIFVSKR